MNPVKICGRCCGFNTQCVESDVIGSCFGRIDDPDCGIKPTIGERTVLVQQCDGEYTVVQCYPPFQAPCTFTNQRISAQPRQCDYELSSDVDGNPACYWIWHTKARCLGFDVQFPSTNRCCCQGQPFSYACTIAAGQQQCTTLIGCSCGVEVCVGAPGCASVGTYDYERDGAGAVIPPGSGGVGGNWFSTRYPGANVAEEAGDDPLTSTFTRQQRGLSLYQKRVAERAYPWMWEILQFNDARPIKVNGANHAYRRADGSAGSAYPFRGTNAAVTTQIATGGHPLMRYLTAFAHPEFAYRRVTDFPVTEVATLDLFQKTTPYKFLFTADGLPLFSFEPNMPTDYLYPPQQYSPAMAVDSAFVLDAIEVDAALKDASMVERMSAKDWRAEVWADLVIVDTWGAAQATPYTAAGDAMATFGDASGLKLMWPCRLPGDQYDLRAINVTTGVPTTARPPSLARASLLSDGQPYPDSVTGNLTGQVDSAIYTIAEVAGMTAPVLAAWQRLTQSVYFRTQPAGWDWSVAAAEGETGRKPRFSWLLNRQLGNVNNGEALRWTCYVPPSPAEACALDNVWCVNGLPQTVNSGSTCDLGTICVGAVCDLYYGHAGYAGTPHILVGRGEAPHRLVDSINCCEPVTLTHHALTVPTHDTSTLCFMRHPGRSYWWDTASGVYVMRPTAEAQRGEHPIDAADICGNFPAIHTQNDTAGGATKFCGGSCDAACSEHSYFVADGDCAAFITAGQVPTRPLGSIAGQRDAPYITRSDCNLVEPTANTSCICDANCAHMYPPVVSTGID